MHLIPNAQFMKFFCIFFSGLSTLFSMLNSWNSFVYSSVDLVPCLRENNLFYMSFSYLVGRKCSFVFNFISTHVYITQVVGPFDKVALACQYYTTIYMLALSILPLQNQLFCFWALHTNQNNLPWRSPNQEKQLDLIFHKIQQL